jgi:hydrogenase small subunit
MRWAVAAPAVMNHADEFLNRLSVALTEAVKEYPIIWLQLSTCSGCSVSVINTIHPSIKNVILEQVLPGHKLVLAYHGTLMAATGALSVRTAMDTAKKHKGKYVLIVEGAVPTKDDGIYGSLGEESGKPITMLHWVDMLGRDAMATLAVGTCAAYGGLSAAQPNPSGCEGVMQVYARLHITTPVINIPGCPSHPDWFVGTVSKILLYGLPQANELDDQGRLKLFFGRSVHNEIRRRRLSPGVGMQRPVYQCRLSHPSVERERELVHQCGIAVHRMYGKRIP